MAAHGRYRMNASGHVLFLKNKETEGINLTRQTKTPLNLTASFKINFLFWSKVICAMFTFTCVYFYT